MRQIAIVCLLTGALFTRAASSAQRAASPLKIDFEMVPSSALVGIPASFHFKFTNSGAEPVAMPRGAELVVRRTDQDREYLALCPNGGEVLGLEEGQPTIAPGQTKDIWLRTNGTLYGHAWFVDGRFFQPGVFELTAYFGNSFVKLETVSSPTIEELRKNFIASSTATFEVRPPTGIDAEAWKILTGDGGWGATSIIFKHGQESGAEVLRRYPRSTYAGWIATSGIGSTVLERARNLREWLKSAPVDEYTPLRQLQLARLDVGAINGMDKSKRAMSIGLLHEARDILRSIAGSEARDDVKKAARKELDVVEYDLAPPEDKSD